MELPQMKYDDRKIKAVWYPGPDGQANPFYEVGDGGVTAIKVYEEPGIYGNLPWLAIFMGEHIMARSPAWAVEVIEYET